MSTSVPAAAALPPAAVHKVVCAKRIRLQRLLAIGEPTDPDPGLVASIAEEIAACCGHSRLKAYRLAYGWTVLQAVETVHAMCRADGLGARGLSERSWKEWEAGGRPSPDYQDLLCRLLRTGPVQLGLASDYSPDGTILTTSGSADTVPLRVPNGWGDMLRRTMLVGASAIGLRNVLDGAGANTATRSGRVNPETVEDLRMIAAGYRRAYRTMPSSRLLPAAHAHLDLALSLNPVLQQEPVRTSLVTAAGEMAALAATLLLLDGGQYIAAAPYLDLAWNAARATDNPEMQAVVLCGKAFAVAYGTGDHRAGLEFADLAREIATTGACHETRGWVAAVASERCASLNDASGCQRRLDEARAALDGASDDDPPWLGIGGFSADKLLAYEGGDMVRLGRYQDAEPILDAAIDRLDGALHRHRCTALIDRAEARLGSPVHSRLGDVDAACNDATAALQLITEIQHASNLARIRDFARRAATTGARSARDLAHTVALAKAEIGTPTGEIV
jgi:hypothetical protein